MGGTAAAAFLVWFAIDELTRPGGQVWFALVCLATVPVVIVIGRIVGY